MNIESINWDLFLSRHMIFGIVIIIGGFQSIINGNKEEKPSLKSNGRLSILLGWIILLELL